MKKILALIANILIRWRDPYPKTVAEVLDDDIKYKKEVLEAVMAFKKTRPWRGSPKVQYVKFQKLNVALSAIYNIPVPTLIFKPGVPSCYFPMAKTIFMEPESDGKYSVVVFLHEYGHALGKNEVKTCTWSINLFRLCFPKSYAKLEPKGHLLYKKKEEEATQVAPQEEEVKIGE
jgi:hypothetical protein